MDRDQLIQLSTEGKIKYKKKFLQTASEETIERICREYANEQLDETNEQLADILISKLSELSEHMKLICSSEECKRNMTPNKLLRKDIRRMVGTFTPYVPYVGLLSGALIFGGLVLKKRMSVPPPPPTPKRRKRKSRTPPPAPPPSPTPEEGVSDDLFEEQAE